VTAVSGKISARTKAAIAGLDTSSGGWIPAPAAPVAPVAEPPAREAAPEDSADALVEACVAGRPGAWETFVLRYAPLILAVARRSLRARGLSPAPDDLDDICHNTFLAFVKDDFGLLRSYDNRFALSTFVGVVARTQAGRFARRRRGGLSDVDVAELPSRVEDPAVAAEEGDLRAALRLTLDEMPERDRAILSMFYFSDRDYRAIATDLGISPNSVGAALHRARERLRARLESRQARRHT
jgi:RNA polymerase sigma-70 factor (ECF subfamily)